MAKLSAPDLQLGRLTKAMHRARLSLMRFREERREMVRVYAGNHWSDEGSKKKRPVNLISLYTRIVTRQLVAKNPRLMISTFAADKKPYVHQLEVHANREIAKMNLARTLQRVALDSLFTMGITKVALGTPTDASRFAWNIEAGKPFAQVVDFDDFIFDVHAKDWGQVSWIGHRYRAPLDAIRDDQRYSKERKELTSQPDTAFNQEGDERVGILGRGYWGDTGEEYEEHVDLWEIYLPRSKRVITLTDAQVQGMGEGEPLLDQEWVGPDTGPYHILAMGDVPANIMPKAPVQDLFDADDATNILYRKIVEQGRRQKTILAVQGSATEDGQRILVTSDGEAVRLDNPDKCKEITFGGPNNSVVLLAQHMKEIFNYTGGNMESLGGLGPQSRTAKQDELLTQGATGQLAEMQDRMVQHTASVGGSLCWYWHHDPFSTHETQWHPQGLPDAAITRKLTPQDRQAIPFEDLELIIDPYSMQHSTPQSRAAALDEVVTKIVLPGQQLLQQQGYQFDIGKYLSVKASYMDMPDLQEIVTIGDAQQDPTGGSGDAPGMPSETTRNYNRTSVGNGSKAATQNNMQQALEANGDAGSSAPLNPAGMS